MPTISRLCELHVQAPQHASATRECPMQVLHSLKMRDLCCVHTRAKLVELRKLTVAEYTALKCFVYKLDSSFETSFKHRLCSNGSFRIIISFKQKERTECYGGKTILILFLHDYEACGACTTNNICLQRISTLAS